MRALTERFRSDWPFSASKVPGFYGWIIAVLTTLGMFMSIPGQTMGMAVFADEFIAAVGLGRTELSTAYLLGTTASALCLTRAGRWFDRYGARFMICAASLGLALTLVFISTAIVPGMFAFALILAGYFGVRFCGQGVLTSASRNMLLLWFERRRGLVSGTSGVFVSLGFSIAPLVIAAMIDTWGWRGALWVMAAVVGVGFSLLALLMVRDRPEVCGLAPDGVVAQAHEASTVRHQVVHMSLEEARRKLVFWVYSLSLSMHAMFGTAVTFHVAAIFEEAGRSRVEAFGYFLPAAVVSVCTNFTASALADRSRLKPFLVLMLTAFVVGAFGLTRLSSSLGYWSLVAGFGVGGGLWGMLANLAFVRQFGTRHLGAISGLNTSITVFASAIGPVLFSLANDAFGSFQAAAWGCLGLLLVLVGLALFIRQPMDVRPSG